MGMLLLRLLLRLSLRLSSVFGGAGSLFRLLLFAAAAVVADSFLFFLFLRVELNERCLAEANSAFGEVHPAIARVYDQKGQILLALKDPTAAAPWFSESRQVCVLHSLSWLLVSTVLSLVAHIYVVRWTDCVVLSPFVAFFCFCGPVFS